MTIVRLSLGGGVFLLAIVGLLICLTVITGVWMLRGRVEAVGNAVFSAADESLVFVDGKIDRVKQALDDSRRRVSGIARAAERLRDAQADTRKECEPLLQALAEVYQQVRAAESWLESSQAVARSVSRVAEAVVSSQYAAAREESTGIDLAQRVEELSATVADVLATLQVLQQELIGLRDKGQLAREVAASIVARVVTLDGKLAHIFTRLEKLDTRLSLTKASIGSLQQRVHWWIVMAAVAITVLWVWFGISQIGMMGHGWRLMQNTRAQQMTAGSSGPQPLNDDA